MVTLQKTVEFKTGKTQKLTCLEVRQRLGTIALDCERLQRGTTWI